MPKPNRGARMFKAIYCSRQGHAYQLARRGVGIGARDFQGCTPLIYAAHSGWQNVVQALLRSGADPNARE